MCYNNNGDDMKRRIKKKPIIIIILTIALLVFGIIYAVKTINYHKTYEYKLLKVGYSKEEIVLQIDESDVVFDRANVALIRLSFDF